MSKPSKKDLQQQKLVFDLFELLEKTHSKRYPSKKLEEKLET